MRNRLKIVLIVTFTILALSGIAYITSFSHLNVVDTLLLNALIILILSFSYLIIFRNAKEIHLAKTQANYWKEKATLEEEAKRSKSYLDAIHDHSSDLICLMKRDGTITYSNPRWEKLMGRVPDEMKGKNILEYIPEEQRESVQKKWKDLTDMNPSISYEANFMKADGSQKPFLVSHHYILKFDEFLVMLRDISELKKFQEDITSIHKLNRTLITIQDVETLVSASLKAASEIMSFKFCDFFLFDEGANELIMYGKIGDSLSIKDQRIPVSNENRIGSAFLQAKEAINLSFGNEDEKFVPMSVREGSELYIPVMTSDKVLGIFHLVLGEKTEYVDASQQLLSELASQTAVAIENARLSRSIVESEEKYRGVVDNIGTGIALLSTGLEILSINNRMRRWFPDVAASSKPLCHRAYFNPPQEARCRECPVEKTLKDGDIHETIINVSSLDNVRIYKVVASPIKGNGGEIIAAIEMFEDITEQMKMEEALKESEQRFRTIFDSSVDGILLTNLETKTCSTGNQAICSMMGYSSEEIGALKIEDIYPEEKLELVKEQFQKLAKGEVTISKEIPIKKKDGSIFFADINMVPISLNGQTYLLSLFRDVTERKRVEDLIKKGKKEWEHTFDSVPDLIAIIGIDHTIKRLNRTMAHYLGRSYQEALGLNYYEIFYGTEEPPAYCPHVQLLNDMKEHQAEIHSDLLGGDFLVTASPLMAADGELQGTIYVAHNITERKKAEKEIIESEERYRGVVEASLIGVFIIQDGVLQFVNNRFCDIFGYQREEIVGKIGIPDLTHSEEKDTVLKSLEDLLAGKVDTLEIQLRSMKKSGEEFPARMLARTFNYLGRPALIGSILDQGREKVLELQLVQSQKMESMGHLAGGIAHDFNNILGIISGSLEILHENGFDSKAGELIDMAMNAVERASGIVKRLLMFSKADEIELVPISLSLIIQECCKILEHTLEKNILVRKAIEAASPIIMGNKEQLIQVLLNICVNARDAMPSGGTITIRLDRTDEYFLRQRFPNVEGNNYYALRITDTGAGMDEKTKEHIFEPFFTTKGREKGTGLGLAIVHGIISRHSGFIDVASVPGKGTTFSLYFPATSLRDDKDAEAIREEVKGGKETIFIVDDEDGLRAILKEQLLSLGYQVLEAKDGIEAISLFNEQFSHIDLVILDIGMPGMSGEEVFMRMKAVDPEVDVLLASGYLGNERRAKLLGFGVREVVQKPYSLRKIAIAMRSILDSRRKKMNMVVEGALEVAD